MSKGFFFSLSALVFLIFAVSAVTQHLASIRENELFYSDLMNMISYQTVFSNFNNDSMSATLGATGKFALYKMANYTAYNPISPTGDDDYDNTRAVFQSLVNNGTSDVSLFDNPNAEALSYSGQEMNYTLGNISGLLNISLSEIGYRMNGMRFENVNLTMESPHSVKVTADLVADVSDAFGKSRYVVVYKSLNSSVSIEGLPDPLVNRYLYTENGKKAGNFSWFIFRHDGNTIDTSFHSDTGKVPFKGSLAGQGWFYGPLISYEQVKAAEDNNNEIKDASLYILYGNISDIVTLRTWEKYGAYILNSSILYEDGDCSSKPNEDPDTVFSPAVYDGNCNAMENAAGTPTAQPFIVLPGFKPGTLSALGDDEKYFIDDGTTVNKRALYFNTEKASPAGAGSKSMAEISIYGIEYIRDQFICAYYLHSQYGPNFFQRMFKSGETYSDTDNGLARLLVEKDFLGANADWAKSSVDFEFIKGWSDSSSHPMFVIRGMPGCKSIEMCSSQGPVRRIIMPERVRDEFSVPDYLYCGISDPLCTGAS